MFSCMWHTPDQPFTELGAIYSGTTYFSRYLYLAGLVSAHLPCLLFLLQSNFSEEAMAHCSHCSCFFSQNAIVSSTLPATASKGCKAISSEGQESSGQGFWHGIDHLPRDRVKRLHSQSFMYSTLQRQLPAKIDKVHPFHPLGAALCSLKENWNFLQISRCHEGFLTVRHAGWVLIWNLRSHVIAEFDLACNATPAHRIQDEHGRMFILKWLLLVTHCYFNMSL